MQADGMTLHSSTMHPPIGSYAVPVINVRCVKGRVGNVMEAIFDNEQHSNAQMRYWLIAP